MKLAKVENITTGVNFEVLPEVYNMLKSTFLFKGWIETDKPIRKTDVATTDIHQMNKGALLVEANKLPGLQVSDKMTVGALKDAILTYKNSIPDEELDAKIEDVIEEISGIVVDVKNSKNKGK